MSDLVTSISAQTAARYSMQVGRAATVQAVAPGREQQLNRQLDERLTAEIARIRHQISPENSPAPSNPEGTGRNLDIYA